MKNIYWLYLCLLTLSFQDKNEKPQPVHNLFDKSQQDTLIYNTTFKDSLLLNLYKSSINEDEDLSKTSIQFKNKPHQSGY